MNFDDFEQKLRRQPMREIPSDWRDEVLSTASPVSVATKWWQEWLWPCPQAWVGLAAAWLIILGLNIATNRNPARPVEFSRQELHDLRQQQQMLANLIIPAETADLPPQRTRISPRSEIRRKEFCV